MRQLWGGSWRAILSAGVRPRVQPSPHVTLCACPRVTPCACETLPSPGEASHDAEPAVSPGPLVSYYGVCDAVSMTLYVPSCVQYWLGGCEWVGV